MGRIISQKIITKVTENASVLTASVEHILCESCFQVNGVRVTPPVSLPGGIKVYLSGTFVVLETDFGLRVRYDGNHHADVTLPSSYWGLLCGLCGMTLFVLSCCLFKVHVSQYSFTVAIFTFFIHLWGTV